MDSEESKRKYELSQKQRAMERSIRATKRKIIMKQQELEAVQSAQEKTALQSDFDRLATRLTAQNKAYNDFCKDNELVPQYERNKVSGYGRSQQGAVNAAYRKSDH